MVGRGDNTRHEDCIDEAACYSTTGLGKDNGERTGGRISIRETRIVVWHVQPNDNDGDDVEKDDTPEDIANHTRQIPGWILGLPGSHSN